MIAAKNLKRKPKSELPTINPTPDFDFDFDFDFDDGRGWEILKYPMASIFRPESS
jgi:hypothetical protein